MRKSIFVIAFVLVSVIFSYSFVFAADAKNVGNDVVNGVRNTVGGAENVVEDAAKGAAGAIKNGVQAVQDTAGGDNNQAQKNTENMGNDVKNTTENVGNDVKNTAENVGNDTKNAAENVGNGINKTGNNAYTATRTATEKTGETTKNWMSSNVWTWIIVGIIAIVIIALIWYYASRNNQ